MTTPATPATLIDLLDASRHAKRAVTYLEGENQRRVVSFAELHQRALGLLHHLQALGAKRGDKVILFLQNNEAFIDAFWGAVLGGIVPVPVAVGISDEHRRKLLRIVAQLGTPFLFSERKTFERIAGFATESGDAAASAALAALRSRTLCADELSDYSRAGQPVAVTPDDIAFIQFSSGSTSEPKGVVLTHGNLIANWQGSAAANRFSSDDITLSWMPLTHDMGLIGMHIFMLGSQMQVHHMPTELFVRRPLLWLQFASQIGATITSSPNFGYRHYLKVLGDRGVDGLDLSRIRTIFNGAEPISVSLAHEFLDRLAPAKLARNAMYPVYGLAEASVAVSFPEPGAPLHSVRLDRHQLTVGAPVRTVAAGDANAIELMAVGKPIPHCELRIAGDDDAPLAAGHVGHIQIRGGNVTRGYYENPAANAKLHTADGWVRTGDLGVQLDGQLYVTGRAKEIIFVNGQNYYPHDLEGVAIRAQGMDLGKVVVSGVNRPETQTDELVVFVLHRTDIPDFLPIANEITRLLNEHTGLEVAEVVPVKRIPKTTSGKIQRHLLEEEYLRGDFAAELAELHALREQLRAAGGGGQGAASEIERRIKAICDKALGREIGVGDNLFEIGASSLKLIEIHEQLDELYPNQVELTELLDYPTISELAAQLEAKLAANR
jgi:acyl-CoA synthetase (AMP-forming)/AMP-acid ligase II/acyl carrier protein